VSRSNRAPRWVRRALPRDPSPNLAAGIVGGAAAAVVVLVVVVATILASAFGSGPSPLSVAGAWNDGAGNTWTFSSSGPDTYTVSEVSKDAPQCAAPHDGTVTGSQGHFQGEVNVYQTGGSTGGACEPKIGLAQITIAIAPTGTSANIDTVGSNCSECGAETWTRKS
jgi:hypothetical protein